MERVLKVGEGAMSLVEGQGSSSHVGDSETGQPKHAGDSGGAATPSSTAVPIVPVGSTPAFQEGSDDPVQPGDAKVSIVRTRVQLRFYIRE